MSYLNHSMLLNSVYKTVREVSCTVTMSSQHHPLKILSIFKKEKISVEEHSEPQQLLSNYNILAHFPRRKVQSDYMNSNLIIKASTGICTAAFSKQSNCESLQYVILHLMEI